MLVTRAENCVEVCGRRFHWVWLRDNCGCAQCCEPHSASKLVDLGQLAGPPVAAQVRLDDRELVVDWAGEPPHRSTFPVPWLLAHAYDRDGAAGDTLGRVGERTGDPALRDPALRDPVLRDPVLRDPVLREPVLWDAATLRARPPEWHDINGCDPDGGPWTEALLTHGFALLTNVTTESLDRFATAIGPRHHTEHGASVTLRTVPDANSLAFSGYELTPHTDYSVHMHTPPLLQFMMCQQHDAVGGESVVVDGFRIAEQLRRSHPEHFAMLATTAVNFEHRYAEHRYLFRRTRRIIELSERGGTGADAIQGVYFAHSHAFTWDLPFDEMEAFYAAYYTFFGYVKSPAFQFRTLLRPGQCIAMRNGRVLHGRTAFDPSSGPRTILDFFVEWDYLAGRLRFAAAAANP